MKSVVVGDETFYPSKILCVGRNYVEHIRELGNEVPENMVVFNKPNSSIATELYSYLDEPLHYEAEICFLVRDKQLFAVGFGLDLTKRSYSRL
ncbi:2-keto-4-pentenoate hydratase [Vibrio maritimus]|uniref:2-keto-4-pentenoate hydratase n=1 Tax=Vibrio maritimus TaxID=990268 RepID=A0A090TA12_9VIBR|nr:2-keto-4-pentenoate hydratase [Vibrio maritimus]